MYRTQFHDHRKIPNNSAARSTFLLPRVIDPAKLTHQGRSLLSASMLLEEFRRWQCAEFASGTLISTIFQICSRNGESGAYLPTVQF
jgi:hypothetical protein